MVSGKSEYSMKRQIDVVIPTYNRLWCLPRVVAFYLALEEVQRVIVVDDGSTDETGNWLKKSAKREPRLLPMLHERNRGASAARNTGADATQAPLVFFADDDMFFSPTDGLCVMAREMDVQGADIAAPIHVISESSNVAALPPINPSFSESHPLLFHRRTLELRSRRLLAACSFPMSFTTPLSCGLMLMRREVLKHVRYDEELGITSYRDETDFQLKALRVGFNILACARPVMIDLTRAQDNGGCHSTSLAKYEWRACLNNWKILVRHRNVIRDQFGIHAPILFLQFCFLAEHAINRFARHYLGRVLRSCGIIRKST
jgi:glycosyltransferase involved in cell wall biosynthesis